jgi:ribosomal protein S18 acetylase RimI-like enzyme
VHTVTLPELVARGDAFLGHHVDRRTFATAWADGDAVVIAFDSRTGGRRLIGLGPADDLVPLLHRVAAVMPRPEGVSNASDAPAAAPWPLATRRVWAWMLCDRLPPEPDLEVVELGDADTINAVLDAANPDSFARPGDPAVECWLGAPADGVPVALGAIARVGDGTGYLRGVTTLPAYRGRGLGAAVSAALTRRAMVPTGVATLGVYVDNDPALAVYRRLGYRTVHTFVSGRTD